MTTLASGGARTTKTRNHVEDLRGASRLAIEATRSVTDLVEAMHVSIGGAPALLGRPLEEATRLVTGLIYGSIRGVTRIVGSGLDRALVQLAPLVANGAAGPERETMLAVLNGVLGDYLTETGNPLALSMQLRAGGRPVEPERESLRAHLPHAGGKLLLLLHGSCRTDRHWLRLGHDHGAALARDLGYTPVYLLYNSGLHISTNGHEFAALLERLVAAWPVPLEKLVIVGHSMGGLVARSACHSAEDAGLAWRLKLDALVCIGTPHHGAKLERGGNWIDRLLGSNRYSAPLARLGRIRSAGVTDLRFGSVLDEHWEGRDRFAHGRDPRRALRLPDGVAFYSIAGTTAPRPRKKLPGDGLVSVDSALGRHRTRALTLAIPEAHQGVAYGTGHLDLLNSPEVYAKLREWLR